MPEVRREGPVRRQLRGLRRGLRAHRPEEPVLDADAARRRCCKSQRALLLQAVATRAASTSCKQLDARTGRLQPEVLNKIQRMVRDRRARPCRPGRLGHQPRRALLRHRDPRRAGQVLLRLARRAGRLPGVAEELLRQGQAPEPRRAIDFDDFMADPDGRAGALHRQGHRLLPHAVLAGDAALLSGRKTPDQVYVHGFITRAAARR